MHRRPFTRIIEDLSVDTHFVSAVVHFDYIEAMYESLNYKLICREHNRQKISAAGKFRTAFGLALVMPK